MFNMEGLLAPNSVASEVESASTTVGIALLAFLSQDNVLFFLGALLAAVRLTYEAIRLWHYLRSVNRKGDTSDG